MKRYIRSSISEDEITVTTGGPSKDVVRAIFDEYGLQPESIRLLPKHGGIKYVVWFENPEYRKSPVRLEAFENFRALENYIGYDISVDSRTESGEFPLRKALAQLDKEIKSRIYSEYPDYTVYGGARGAGNMDGMLEHSIRLGWH